MTDTQALLAKIEGSGPVTREDADAVLLLAGWEWKQEVVQLIPSETRGHWEHDGKCFPPYPIPDPLHDLNARPASSKVVWFCWDEKFGTWEAQISDSGPIGMCSVASWPEGPARAATAAWIRATQQIA